MRIKSNLSVGKRCRRTTKKRSQTISAIHCSVWTKTEDEIFNRVPYPCLNTGNVYTPKIPATKSFRSRQIVSPLTSKGKNVLKRVNLSTRKDTNKETPITPSKSPSVKKVRRSLYNAEQSNTKNNPYDSTEKLLRRTANERYDCLKKTSDFPEFFYDENQHYSEPSFLQSEITEMIDLIPVVMENLSTEGLDKQLLTFFRLVKEAKFPLKNIAFQLWLEVVKWFGCENSTEMRYCESSKKFWKLGYRLFGGQFLHFMSGYKNKNSVVLEDTEKGIYPPSQSEINFAVPSKDILTAFSPYGIDKCLDGVLGRPPGILTDMVETLAKSPSVSSYCLTFDRKKLKRGLGKSSGDVDLLGFEPGISLAERIKQAESIKQPIEELLRLYSGKDEMVIMGTDLENGERQQLSCMLADQLKKVSLNILSVRDLRKKKLYAKEKLMDRSGGTDWKNGKYVLAISCLIAFIHDIDEYLKESIMLVDELSLCICSLRQSQSAVNQSVLNLDTCRSYVQIRKADNMSETRQIKQRTPEWFARRSKALVTGSTIYSAVGLDGLAKQKEHFDLVVGGLPEKEIPEKVMKAMNHGTLNEINAVATMAGKVLPMLCPGQRMYEEGFVEMSAAKSGRPFMVVSPDGSVRLGEVVESTSVAIELKCPIFDIQHNFPQRYLLQCLSEMEALDVDTLLYLCWRPDLSTVFKVNRNRNLFNKAFNLAKSLYDIDKPKRPTKLTPEAKSLKEDINNACENNTTKVESIPYVGSFYA